MTPNQYRALERLAERGGRGLPLTYFNTDDSIAYGTAFALERRGVTRVLGPVAFITSPGRELLARKTTATVAP